MPTVANGIDLQWNLHRASGQNIEFEWRKPRTARDSFAPVDGATTIRLLTFINRANMGSYRDQINLALNTHTTPDITAHSPQTTTKYGFGLNAEQELTPNLRAFIRFGWNEGRHESYAYTEVDQTFEAGADYAATRWHRPNDKLGLALVSNAIKRDHQHYLALGGQGFLLGDGRLHYAREDILETYYTAHNWRGLFTALDVQLIAHPGYNQDRGPVAVFSVRTHLDF
jgi:carbohydrate-selective porin OprB